MNLNDVKNRFVQILNDNKYLALSTLALVLAFAVFVIVAVYNMLFRKEKYANIQEPEDENIKDMYYRDESLSSPSYMSSEDCEVVPYSDE